MNKIVLILLSFWMINNLSFENLVYKALNVEQLQAALEAFEASVDRLAVGVAQRLVGAPLVPGQP